MRLTFRLQAQDPDVAIVDPDEDPFSIAEETDKFVPKPAPKPRIDEWYREINIFKVCRSCYSSFLINEWDSWLRLYFKQKQIANHISKH